MSRRLTTILENLDEVPEFEYCPPLWIRLPATPKFLFVLTILTISFQTIYYILAATYYTGPLQILVMFLFIIVGSIILEMFYSFIERFLYVMCDVGDKENGHGIKEIFMDNSRFVIFKTRALEHIIDSPNDSIRSIIIGICLYVPLPLSSIIYDFQLGRDPFALASGQYGILWIILRIIESSYFSIVVIALVSMVLTIVRILHTVSWFNSEGSYLTLYNVVEDINEERKRRDAREKKEDFTFFKNISDKGYYATFYRVACSTIDAFTRISILVLVVAGIVGIFTAALNLQGQYNTARLITGQFSALLGIVLGLALFIYPQMKMHSLMEGYKSSMINLLQDIHEQNIMNYIFLEKPDRISIAEDIIVIRKALDYHESLDVWPYSGKQLAEIVGSIIVVAQSGFIQVLAWLLNIPA